MLEQRVKRMKMIAPKGATSTEMWTRVARNVDRVDKIVQNGMRLLHLRDNDEYAMRTTSVEREMIKWRAVLRESKYLEMNSGDSVLNIHGSLLNRKLANVLKGNSIYRSLYFEKALTTELQNIRYKDFQVVDSETMEDITPFQSEDEDDEDAEKCG